MSTSAPRDALAGITPGQAAAASSPRRPLVLALHGIMTGGQRVNWTERFQAWSLVHMADCVVWTQNYWRWPTPRFNWIPNAFRSRKLAAWLGPLLREGHRVHLVGHSNGAAIALATCKLLAKQGLTVDSLLLIGAAISCDVKKSGIQALIASGRLHRATCWWSKTDGVIGLPGPLLWPYGKLGALGFQQRIRTVAGALRWASGDGEFLKSIEFRGGHSEYFTLARSPESFAAISAWVRGLPFNPVQAAARGAQS